MSIAIMKPQKRTRPPPQPKILTPTWRYAARRSTNDPNLAALYGAALLAVEARRRRQLIAIGKKEKNNGNGNSTALQSRVRCLEKELDGLNRGVESCKRGARGAIRSNKK